MRKALSFVFLCLLFIVLSLNNMFAQENSVFSAREWKKSSELNLLQRRGMAKAASADFDSKIGPADAYGTLNAPDGSIWTYTISLTQKKGFFDKAEVKVFDAKNELVGQFVDSMKIEGTLGVNYVEVTSLVTKKFFNTDNNYEVILFMHAVTEDYRGRYVSKAYSLCEESNLVCAVEGSYVLAKNTNAINESYVVVFQEQEYQGDTLLYNYNVYSRASYASPNAPILMHSFTVDYQHIAALNDLMPIAMVENNGKLNFVLSQYEKPYFENSTSDLEDPVVTKDNNLLIHYYSDEYELLSETKIPVVLQEGYLYTFPNVGGLSGANDILLNYAGGDTPAYIVTMDNYDISSDGSVRSFYLYDVDGNLLDTIAENVMGVLRMSDVAGHSEQWAFLKVENEVDKMIFVDLATCERVAELPLLNDGMILSTSIDRCANGDSYQYVVALLQGEIDANGNAVHKIAWFNADGSFERFDKINLGKGVENAKFYIDAAALNPWLFAEDDLREYMVLIYRAKDGSTAKDEVLAICNTKGNLVAEFTPDSEKGGDLAEIILMNSKNNPTLLCSYSDGDKFTLNFVSLPLVKTTLDGDGTPENPYKIASASDFFKIDNAPSAYYEIINDINFMGVAFDGLNSTFKGSLDGKYHWLKNLSLDGSGLFRSVEDSAKIKNIRIYEPYLVVKEGMEPVGLVANYVMGGLNDTNGEGIHVSIENIHLNGANIIATPDFNGTIGGIVGEAVFYADIVKCSLNESDIVAPNAEMVGGIAGSLATSASVKSSVFLGNIKGGSTVGAITASAGSGEKVFNCHVNANIEATTTVGGIVGDSERARIANCYVEGTIAVKENPDIAEYHMGGIVGKLANSFSDTTEIVVANCIVDLETMLLPRVKDGLFAHRIVGHSSSDSWEYDWDNIDYNKPQSEWPKIYGKPERCIRGNVVVSDLPVIDMNVKAKEYSTEGETMSRDLITKEWMEQHNYLLGSEIDTPWVLGENILLWYESELDDMPEPEPEPEPEPDAVEIVELDNKLVFDGEILSSEGVIRVYNISGVLMMNAENSLNISSLPAGVYVVTVTSEADSFATKVLVR